MKLDEIELYQLHLPLFEPYKVSHRVFQEFTPIFVQMRAEGEEGWGEALISTGYSKETIDGGWEFCREMARSVQGKDVRVARSAIAERANESPNAASALLVALDMLERDELLVVEADARIPLLAPCQAAHDLHAVRTEVEKLLEQGFRTLKVKVGFAVDDDLKRVHMIQEVVNGRASLRLDANRAFDRTQGCAFASRLEPVGIELFEQPCASAAWDANAAVAAVSTVPVMLDESIYGIDDIERASRIQGVRYVKLKLKKMGSVGMLKAALQRIRALGMEPVLGDGVSVELSCWMEACVARSTIENAGEMNGFLKAKVNVFADPLPFEAGAIVLREGYRPRVDHEIVKRHTIRQDRFAAQMRR